VVRAGASILVRCGARPRAGPTTMPLLVSRRSYIYTGVPITNT